MAQNKKSVKASNAQNSAIIGTWKGKACDAKVVNNNGMFLDEQLFDNILSSEEYKNGIKNRWFFTYMGHPDEVDAGKDDKDVVGLLKSMSKEGTDIYAEIDLIDTPLGRIVKTLIDAGVNFGVSIRGAGDVAEDGTVDPNTFIFRGFDIVRFPAYEDCIPTFQSIAASTDMASQKKYSAVCKAIKENVPYIKSSTAIDELKHQFNEHSTEYKILEDRSEELNEEEFEDCQDKDLLIQVLEEKLKSMTELYLEMFNANKELASNNNMLTIENSKLVHASNRKFESFERIMSSQNRRLSNKLDKTEKKLKLVSASNSALKDSLQSKVVANSRLADSNSKLKSTNSRLQDSNKELINANTDLKEKNRVLDKRLNNEINNNLIYRQKIESNREVLAENDKTISDLTSRYETVMSGQDLSKKKVSNLEDTVKSLKARIEASENLVRDYQQAYADMCATSIGIRLENIPITNSTTVKELRDYIYGSTNTCSIPAAPSIVEEPEEIEIEEALDPQSIVTI